MRPDDDIIGWTHAVEACSRDGRRPPALLYGSGAKVVCLTSLDVYGGGFYVQVAVSGFGAASTFSHNVVHATRNALEWVSETAKVGDIPDHIADQISGWIAALAKDSP